MALPWCNTACDLKGTCFVHLQLKEWCAAPAQVSKALACGDVGLGAMAAPQTINDAAHEALPHLCVPGQGAGT